MRNEMIGRRRVRLLSYATPGFYSQQRVLAESALRVGLKDVAPWTDIELRKTAFYRRHVDILDSQPGAGYWLWKPFLINEELKRLESGDFLVYYDVGRAWMPHKISTSLKPLLEWCENDNGGILPGVYIPEHGPNKDWTKRECFVSMGCDAPKYWEHPQIQATYSVWQNVPRVAEFASEWLHWCITPGILTDEVKSPSPPNFSTFRAHRHDQSVITNLALLRSIKCYGNPQTILPESKDINNLVDRISGRESRIVIRNFSRRIAGKLRLSILRNKVRMEKLRNNNAD
jgi:hypothetical protein